MLFGYLTAALAGFMLTAIPNWTGRLPVSGPPLLALVMLWLCGRLSMAAPDVLGLPASLTIDALFLPVLAVVAGIEVVAGRNWKNFKILAGLVALSLANVAFHAQVLMTVSATDAVRPAVSVYLLLIAVVGGRMIPSFTRNWLVKAGVSRVPKPFSTFDKVAIIALSIVLCLWSIWPDGWATAAGAFVAAALHVSRLLRWRGHAILEEPLLLALHIAYGFIPAGLVGVGFAALGILSASAALHLLVVGALGNMTLAVMMRAALGYTGRIPAANPIRSVALLALVLAAVIRPFAEILPNNYHVVLGSAGALWCVAFGLFCIEFLPILAGARPLRRNAT